MMYISEIYLKNYKVFKECSIQLNKEKNIFIGDNGVGKTTIINAIESVLECKFVERVSFVDLINVDAVEQFMNSGKTDPDHLPKVVVELYFEDNLEIEFEGSHNTRGEQKKKRFKANYRTKP